MQQHDSDESSDIAMSYAGCTIHKVRRSGAVERAGLILAPISLANKITLIFQFAMQ
jgi:hypothetical protein